jgi:hypothetical protein
MEVEKAGEAFRLVMSPGELKLLRAALERASFIDTPPEQQAAILNFCARALELLPRT